MTRVIVHIDRLVLHGLDRADAAGISAGLQSELQRLLASPEAAAGLVARGDLRQLQGGSLKLSPRDPAADTGRAVARRVIPGVRS